MYAVLRGGPLDGLHVPRQIPLPAGFQYGGPRGYRYLLTYVQGFLAFYECVGRRGVKLGKAEGEALNRARYHAWIRRHPRAGSFRGRVIEGESAPDTQIIDEELVEELR